jgi:hypothetical protein
MNESLWLRISPELLQSMRELAVEKGMTLHDLARLCLSLGFSRLKRGEGQQLTLGEVAKPTEGSR